MIKKHKRTRKGWMRRTSRVYLNNLNKDKTKSLISFLNGYTQALNYAVARTWSDHVRENRMSINLASKEFTDALRTRFNTTARLSQCISKQAKEMCLSQKEKNKHDRRMPRMTRHVANLDSRLVTISEFDGSFDFCMKLSSGAPKMIVPFNKTVHLNKFLSRGWLLSKSVRLGYNERGLFADLILEKEKPPMRTEGTVLGIDRGFNTMLATSDGQFIGKELKEQIKKGGKRRKSWHHYIETEALRYLKQLKLTNVKTISIENLKNVKKDKRGKFSRKVNRLLSFWLYAKVGERLRQLCEETGIRLEFKSPWKTSQRCAVCGNIGKRNRNGEKFLCLNCGHADNADHNASKNLELLGLAGVYSLRSLKS